jgi:hypothetical protein
MTTSFLRFDGPSQQSRIQIVSLLKEFPQVLFREHAPSEYEVTAADEAALRALARKPGWSLTGTH